MCLYEGGGSTIYSLIFEMGWLKGNSVQRQGVAYTSEYGNCQVKAGTLTFEELALTLGFALQITVHCIFR